MYIWEIARYRVNIYVFSWVMCLRNSYNVQLADWNELNVALRFERLLQLEFY